MIHVSMNGDIISHYIQHFGRET